MTYRKWTGGPDQVLDYLNNARRLGPFPQAGLPLGGKTLVFTDPTATVTFPGDEGAMVPLSDVMQQLQAEVPGLHVASRAGPNAQSTASVHGLTRYLALYRDGGLGIGKGGTSNGLFGFSTDEDTKVKPPIADDNIKLMMRPTPAEYEVIVAGADEDFEEPAAIASKKRAT